MLNEKTLRHYAEEGYTMGETARILGIHPDKVRYWARKYGIEFIKKKAERNVLNWRERQRQFVRLYNQGVAFEDIVREMNLNRNTARRWLEQIDALKLKYGSYDPRDPRSYVCQQIPSCRHSNCYLAPRCPAHQAYLKEREAKKK